MVYIDIFNTDQKFNILYVDPPWSYNNKNTGGSMKSGSSAKYPTMTLDEIKSLPIKEISNSATALFLWGTTPLLPEALEVMNAWGFKYKTAVYWHKVGRLGLGFWFRGEVEPMLVGIRGNVKAFRCQFPNYIEAPVLKHSEKPEEFRQLIETATSNMSDRNKIELFARKRVNGWNYWGNEV